MEKKKLTFEQFKKLSKNDRNKQYKNLSNHDKFKARINDTIKCEVIGKSTLSKEELKSHAEKMKKEIRRDHPRWLHEIPGIKDNGKKRKLSKKEKQDVKDIRNAIKNHKIDEWFNKDRLKQCEKCFYYKLCTQHDYIDEEKEKEESQITNNICGIYEDGIPKEIWDNKKKCSDFIKDNIKKDEQKEINIG